MEHTGKIPLNRKDALGKPRHLFFAQRADMVEKRAYLRYDGKKEHGIWYWVRPDKKAFRNARFLI